ncbi:MAG: DinB family protein [Vicingaceae bacterium]
MKAETFPVYYHDYIKLVPEQTDPQELLDYSLKELFKSLAMVTEEKAEQAYAEGKWSIKDIVQHMIDTERIFCFRALAFARGEKQDIFGYDHNAYVNQAKANNRSLKAMLEELKRLRQSTKDLFESFDETMFARKGTANGKELSVEQIRLVIIGHEMHHLKVIESKYLFG